MKEGGMCQLTGYSIIWQTLQVFTKYLALLPFQMQGRFVFPTSLELGVDVGLLGHESRSDVCQFSGEALIASVQPFSLFLYCGNCGSTC